MLDISSGSNPPTDTCRAALPIQWRRHDWRGHFPQLSLEDRVIWGRWLTAHGADLDWYAYDVPIGGVDCDQQDAPEPIRRAWRYCTAKRIDVLGWHQGAATIFEVRYQAGVSALGALLTYSYLYREHNPHQRRPTLKLLSDTMSPDTIRAAQHYGITVHLLPA